PHQREQVATDRGHVRVHDAEHGVGGDGRVDRVAALAQHLRPRFGGEVVRGGNDAVGQGTTSSSAPGRTSKVAGSAPGSSPSASTRTTSDELTSTRFARAKLTFGLLSSR